MIQPIKFFTSNIGKRIFRDYHKCCKECDDISENGLVVFDEMHARYLDDVQNCYASEGIFLNYRDEK